MSRIGINVFTARVKSILGEASSHNGPCKDLYQQYASWSAGADVRLPSVVHSWCWTAVLRTLPLSGRQGEWGGAAERWCWPAHSRGVFEESIIHRKPQKTIYLHFSIYTATIIQPFISLRIISKSEITLNALSSLGHAPKAAWKTRQPGIPKAALPQGSRRGQRLIGQYHVVQPPLRAEISTLRQPWSSPLFYGLMTIIHSCVSAKHSWEM